MQITRPSLEPWVGLPSAGSVPATSPMRMKVSPDSLQAGLWASCRYLLRAILAGVDVSDGDILSAIILVAVMDANIGHLDADPALAWRYATYDQGPPDGFRRPTTVQAVADRLGLPYETARRRIEGLISQGLCVRTPHGVYAPAIFDPRHRAGTQANYAAIRVLLRDLRTRIPEVEWPAAGGFDAESAGLPLRLVSRRTATFAVDVLSGLARMAGGYDEALAYMGIVEATGRDAFDGAWPTLRTSPLARSLNQPIPSVRRRLLRLAARGLVTPAGVGYNAGPAASAETEVSRMAVANLRHLHRLFDQLARLKAPMDARPDPFAASKGALA